MVAFTPSAREQQRKAKQVVRGALNQHGYEGLGALMQQYAGDIASPERVGAFKALMEEAAREARKAKKRFKRGVVDASNGKADAISNLVTGAQDSLIAKHQKETELLNQLLAKKELDLIQTRKQQEEIQRRAGEVARKTDQAIKDLGPKAVEALKQQAAALEAENAELRARIEQDEQVMRLQESEKIATADAFRIEAQENAYLRHAFELMQLQETDIGGPSIKETTTAETQTSPKKRKIHEVDTEQTAEKQGTRSSERPAKKSKTNTAEAATEVPVATRKRPKRKAAQEAEQKIKKQTQEKENSTEAGMSVGGEEGASAEKPEKKKLTDKQRATKLTKKVKGLEEELKEARLKAEEVLKIAAARVDEAEKEVARLKKKFGPAYTKNVVVADIRDDAARQIAAAEKARDAAIQQRDEALEKEREINRELARSEDDIEAEIEARAEEARGQALEVVKEAARRLEAAQSRTRELEDQLEALESTAGSAAPDQQQLREMLRQELQTSKQVRDAVRAMFPPESPAAKITMPSGRVFYHETVEPLVRQMQQQARQYREVTVRKEAEHQAETDALKARIARLNQDNLTRDAGQENATEAQQKDRDRIAELEKELATERELTSSLIKGAAAKQASSASTLEATRHEQSVLQQKLTDALERTRQEVATVRQLEADQARAEAEAEQQKAVLVQQQEEHAAEKKALEEQLAKITAELKEEKKHTARLENDERVLWEEELPFEQEKTQRAKQKASALELALERAIVVRDEAIAERDAAKAAAGGYTAEQTAELQEKLTEMEAQAKLQGATIEEFRTDMEELDGELAAAKQAEQAASERAATAEQAASKRQAELEQLFDDELEAARGEIQREVEARMRGTIAADLTRAQSLQQEAQAVIDAQAEGNHPALQQGVEDTLRRLRRENKSLKKEVAEAREKRKGDEIRDLQVTALGNELTKFLEAQGRTFDREGPLSATATPRGHGPVLTESAAYGEETETITTLAQLKELVLTRQKELEAENAKLRAQLELGASGDQLFEDLFGSEPYTPLTEEPLPTEQELEAVRETQQGFMDKLRAAEEPSTPFVKPTHRRVQQLQQEHATPVVERQLEPPATQGRAAAAQRKVVQTGHELWEKRIAGEQAPRVPQPSRLPLPTARELDSPASKRTASTLGLARASTDEWTRQQQKQEAAKQQELSTPKTPPHKAATRSLSIFPETPVGGESRGRLEEFKALERAVAQTPNDEPAKKQTVASIRKALAELPQQQQQQPRQDTPTVAQLKADARKTQDTRNAWQKRTAAAGQENGMLRY